MKLIKQTIFIFLFLFSPIFIHAAPVCDADPKTIKLLKEMVANAKLAEVIKSNGELAKYWNTIGAEDLINAWSVIEKDKNLRKDPKLISRLHIFIESEKLTVDEIKKLKKSFDSQKKEDDRKKWIKLKYTEADLESKYASMSQNPPPKLTPWTEEHKAQRWNNYNNKTGKKLSYAQWSNIYDGNINKSKRADEAATNYAKTIPNTKKEQTYKDIIKIDLNGKIVEGKRRHDIIQTNALGELKAIEVKDYRSSKVYLSEDIKREALMDIELLKNKDNKVKEVEWVFKVNGENGEPSTPLRAFLESNGIKVKII